MVLHKFLPPQEDDHTMTTSSPSPFLKINKNIGKENGQLPLLFTVVLICSVFQFYVLPPVMGIFIPLYLVAAYALALQVNWLEAGKTTIGLILIGLYSVQTLSILWSPDKILGVRDIIYTFPFLIIYLYVQESIQKNPQGIWKSIRIFCAVALIQSFLVIFFWKMPSLQDSLRYSLLGKIFLNPNWLESIQIEMDMKNGIAQAGSLKAGGFLINGNIAGAWAASLLYITIAAFVLKRASNNEKKTNSPFVNKNSSVTKTEKKRKLHLIGHKIIAPVHALSIFLCGSKASLGLFFLAPLLSRGCLHAPTRNLLIVAAVLGVLFMAVFLPFYSDLANIFFSSDYIEQSARTFMSRFFLWQHAWEEFLKHPLLGQGYGGWERSMVGVSQRAYGLDLDVQDTFPPHNSFIYLWSQNGLLALGLGLSLVVVTVRTFRTFYEKAALQAFCFLTAYLFFIIQACAENYPIVGEYHQTAAIALMTGIAAGLTHAKKEPLIKL